MLVAAWQVRAAGDDAPGNGLVWRDVWGWEPQMDIRSDDVIHAVNGVAIPPGTFDLLLFDYQHLGHKLLQRKPEALLLHIRRATGEEVRIPLQQWVTQPVPVKDQKPGKKKRKPRVRRQMIYNYLLAWPDSIEAYRQHGHRGAWDSAVELGLSRYDRDVYTRRHTMDNLYRNIVWGVEFSRYWQFPPRREEVPHLVKAIEQGCRDILVLTTLCETLHAEARSDEVLTGVLPYLKEAKGSYGAEDPWHGRLQLALAAVYRQRQDSGTERRLLEAGIRRAEKAGVRTWIPELHTRLTVLLAQSFAKEGIMYFEKNKASILKHFRGPGDRLLMQICCVVQAQLGAQKALALWDSAVDGLGGHRWREKHGFRSMFAEYVRSQAAYASVAWVDPERGKFHRTLAYRRSFAPAPAENTSGRGPQMCARGTEKYGLLKAGFRLKRCDAYPHPAKDVACFYVGEPDTETPRYARPENWKEYITVVMNRQGVINQVLATADKRKVFVPVMTVNPEKWHRMSIEWQAGEVTVKVDDRVCIAALRGTTTRPVHFQISQPSWGVEYTNVCFYGATAKAIDNERLTESRENWGLAVKSYDAKAVRDSFRALMAILSEASELKREAERAEEVYFGLSRILSPAGLKLSSREVMEKWFGDGSGGIKRYVAWRSGPDWLEPDMKMSPMGRGYRIAFTWGERLPAGEIRGTVRFPRSSLTPDSCFHFAWNGTGSPGPSLVLEPGKSRAALGYHPYKKYGTDDAKVMENMPEKVSFVVRFRGSEVVAFINDGTKPFLRSSNMPPVGHGVSLWAGDWKRPGKAPRISGLTVRYLGDDEQLDAPAVLSTLDDRKAEPPSP